ncbi:hypothetical protein J7L48_03045 [bacterium]|nr:hypothetical protein [bacterium]
MKRIMTIGFYIILFSLFILFQDFAKNYRKFIIVPNSIYHKGPNNHIAGDIEKNKSSEMEEKNHHEASEHHYHSLDYIHTRILNHPWNNQRIIQMILLQGLFYAILGGILVKKVFYE